ncbi:MAG: hypothetical protein HKM04_09610 [Legionellales bacterium]|nr:hypothetical protein [Legionellales bacterium]
MKNTAQIGDKKAANVFVSKVQSRQEKLLEMLAKMPEFYDFLTGDGSDALQEIIDEAKINNAKIDKKLAEGKVTYAPLAIDIKSLIKNYETIKQTAFNKQVLTFEIGNNNDDIQPVMTY